MIMAIITILGKVMMMMAIIIITITSVIIIIMSVDLEVVLPEDG